jgi:hypothetical protein
MGEAFDTVNVSRRSSWGMKRCERLKKLHYVTCIVVRSKGDSDPLAAR